MVGMTLSEHLRSLADALATSGWDRVQGTRLAAVAHQIHEHYQASGWTAVIGRAEALVGILSKFISEAPSAQRLAPVLRTANSLADLLKRGPLAERVDLTCLPEVPGDWTFVVAEDGCDVGNDLFTDLRSLGFTVEQAAGIEAVEPLLRTGQAVLLAGANWLVAHAPRLLALLPEVTAAPPSAPVVVAVLDTDDFSAQLQVRHAGARLLFDAPLDIDRLLGDLAGLAWMPRAPYRILLINDDCDRLEQHAGVLRTAGCEVLTSADPLTIWTRVAAFAPETCVVDVAMSACSGIDFIALLRRDKRFTRLPAIYLSATDTSKTALAARYAGGEEYFVEPVDPHLFTVAALARARQFRLFECVYFQRRRAWYELADMKKALDRHAIISVTDPDGTIIDVNPKFCQISSYRREDLIGRNHRIIKSGNHPPALLEEMWRTIVSGNIWQGELQNRRKDGSSYWVQATIAPILNEQDRIERYISIRTDITEQKRVLAEQERQVRLLDLQRQVLQRFIATQDLAATSAWLLNGLLILTGSAHGFILERCEETDGTPFLKPQAISGLAWDEQTRHLLKTAQAEGMEFRNLQHRLGAILHTGESVILNDLAKDALLERLPAGHPSLQTFLGLPIRAGDRILGILGLANRTGGYDQAEVDFLQTLTATYAGILNAARLRAIQQGVINELTQAQAAAERTNRLPARHDSDPATATQAPSTAPIRIKAKPQGRSRILIAEDNPANQALLRMQIEALGYDADIAADGAAALVKWQAGGYDMLLADLNMPGMDGLALTRSIRAAEREHGGHLPIIAITATHRPEALANCRAAGMDDVLSKPIELNDLRQRLDHWLPCAESHTVIAPEPATLAGNMGAILDTQYLSRALGHISQQQMRDLVDLFIATVRAELPACRHLHQDSDARSLALAMHKLKSSARMVGALRFASLAEQLEEDAKMARMDAVPSLLAELKHAINDVDTAAQQLATSSPSTDSDAETPPLSPEILPRRVLVVDDDAIARRQTSMLLASMGVGEILTADSGEAALTEITRGEDGGIDLLITDLKMPGMDGIEFLRRLAKLGYLGALVISSGVDEQLLQTAADLVRSKGLHLRGAVKKPLTCELLANLLTASRDSQARRPVQAVAPDISPSDLLDGIRRDEFSMHFQPKVDATTLRMVGVEALARWQHDGQSVRPDLFIGAAERHGLIAPLSRALLAKTLNDASRLAEAGFPLIIAFNLSACWLSDIHLPEFILESIQAVSFPAERLILEITETTLLSDLDITMDVLTRLRLNGFKLSIDDFGTGYSSMEQLQRIPFSELKLDRSFVQGAAERPTVRAILSASIDMARKLRLSTVAEGVETQADLDLVRGLGCDLVQGWLIAKAMPVAELIDWLRSRAAQSG
jgi:PAS domain S-box-containing protein